MIDLDVVFLKAHFNIFRHIMGVFFNESVILIIIAWIPPYLLTIEIFKPISRVMLQKIQRGTREIFDLILLKSQYKNKTIYFDSARINRL